MAKALHRPENPRPTSKHRRDDQRQFTDSPTIQSSTTFIEGNHRNSDEIG
ncbi:hypothetical protein OAE46_00745 [bacterium]|nr:hypothetical protein [bacterium]